MTSIPSTSRNEREGAQEGGMAGEGGERQPWEGVVWMSSGVPNAVLVVVVDVEGRHLHGRKSEKEI